MKAVFTVRGENGSIPSPSYDVGICFNGQPGQVVLEVSRVDWEGYSGAGDNPQSEYHQKRTDLCRMVLESSHARAIASAMLSAATESRSHV